MTWHALKEENRIGSSCSARAVNPGSETKIFADFNFMKRLTLLCAMLWTWALPVFPAEKAAPLNQLSKMEIEEGWKLLFDGKSLEGWRSYRKPDAPTKGWVVENGTLHLQPKSGVGDLVSTGKFRDFDLRWEWKLADKANNGLKYFVNEDRLGAPGPEYQMIDDTTSPNPKSSTASLYDVLPPLADKELRPPGVWNSSRILVKGNRVEHWLNGKLALAYELGSAELKVALAQSKFKDAKGFGEKFSGPIMLTEHHDETWYRNIKILELPNQ